MLTGYDKSSPIPFSRNDAAWRFYKATQDLYKVMKIPGHGSIQQTEEYVAGFEDDSLDDDFRTAIG